MSSHLTREFRVQLIATMDSVLRTAVLDVMKLFENSFHEHEKELAQKGEKIVQLEGKLEEAEARLKGFESRDDTRAEITESHMNAMKTEPENVVVSHGQPSDDKADMNEVKLEGFESRDDTRAEITESHMNAMKTEPENVVVSHGQPSDDEADMDVTDNWCAPLGTETNRKDDVCPSVRLRMLSIPLINISEEQVNGQKKALKRSKTDLDAAEEKERREYKKKDMRHKEVTPEELNSLEDQKEEVNTEKTTRWAVKIFRDFLAQKNMDINFENYTATTLNDILRLFYASVQSTKERGEYSVSSFRSLRAGINRHLRDVNIISDAVFKSSNAVFKAILKRYRKSGKDTSFHHPRIPESDLEIIRCSSALSPDTPLGLVRKVWFDIQLCLARRGKEGNRELTMTSFSIQRDEDGVEYVNLAHPDTKYHKDPNNPHKQNLRGFMFAKPGDPLCPVKSFKKYISKCPPDAKSFYLHPKRSITVASDVWYSKEPMGLHYLGDMLKKISEEVGLSRIYTNHSLRSTAVGRLSDAGLDTH